MNDFLRKWMEKKKFILTENCIFRKWINFSSIHKMSHDTSKCNRFNVYKWGRVFSNNRRHIMYEQRIMKFSIFPSILNYHSYRMFLRTYCVTYEECVFQKIILCMMSFCKKNHLSYLDTIESGAEEDIFQRLQELYIVAYLLSFERLFLFPKMWKI